MKVKKVYKYATGVVIPEGAVYLSTQVETATRYLLIEDSPGDSITTNLLVWHYFLVEVEIEGENI